MWASQQARPTALSSGAGVFSTPREVPVLKPQAGPGSAPAGSELSPCCFSCNLKPMENQKGLMWQIGTETGPQVTPGGAHEPQCGDAPPLPCIIRLQA